MKDPGTINVWVQWFEDFTTHAVIWSILLALAGSWALTHFVKFPLYRWCVKHQAVDWFPFYTRVVATTAAAIVMLVYWPGEHRLTWSFVLAFGSCPIYDFAAWIAYKIAPTLAAKLSPKTPAAPPA